VYLPIIETYTRGTRFEGRVAINPNQLVKGSLNFFFFRSDPRGLLARHLDSCSYIHVDDVVLCSLPFLEEMSKLVTLTSEELADANHYEWNDELLGKIGISRERLIEIVVPVFTAISGNVALQWVIGHEIGHAVDGDSAAIGSMSSRRQVEEKADRFFVERVPGEQEATKIMLTFVANLVAQQFGRIFAEQHGKTFRGFDVEDRQITLHDAGGPHPPLLLRVLDLAERLLEAYPEVDQTGHYGRVRRLITVVEVAHG
jgi:hypothetical protein